MKTVTIFFGEMGCGKTYCASRYAERHGFQFFEGDSVVTPRMLERVQKFKPLTRDIVEEYVGVLSNAIADQMNDCDNLVVSQALYLNEDRVSIKLFLEFWNLWDMKSECGGLKSHYGETSKIFLLELPLGNGYAIG
jgi:hypothetical protein